LRLTPPNEPQTPLILKKRPMRIGEGNLLASHSPEGLYRYKRRLVCSTHSDLFFGAEKMDL